MPGPIASTARPSVWIARTRASTPCGSTRTWSPGGDRAVGQRAGHDGAAALGREHPVDPQPGPAAIGGRRRRAGELGERRRQLGQAVAERRGDGHDRRAGEERARRVLGDLQRGELDELGVVEHVDLGQRDDAVAHADQLEDPQVLLALRLPPLGGGDHEQAGVDAADAGQHVAQEPDVAGHVDEADRLAVDDGVGEAEVDRQAAALLLGEAVGIGAGQREDERRLAVVDVAGGGDHPHRRRASTTHGVVGRLDGAQVERR